jgi:hypothetical protein
MIPQPAAHTRSALTDGISLLAFITFLGVLAVSRRVPSLTETVLTCHHCLSFPPSTHGTVSAGPHVSNETAAKETKRREQNTQIRTFLKQETRSQRAPQPNRQVRTTKQSSSSKIPDEVKARAFHVAQALGLVPHEYPDDVLVGEVGLPSDHIEHLLPPRRLLPPRSARSVLRKKPLSRDSGCVYVGAWHCSVLQRGR